MKIRSLSDSNIKFKRALIILPLLTINFSCIGAGRSVDELKAKQVLSAAVEYCNRSLYVKIPCSDFEFGPFLWINEFTMEVKISCLCSGHDNVILAKISKNTADKWVLSKFEAYEPKVSSMSILAWKLMDTTFIIE